MVDGRTDKERITALEVEVSHVKGRSHKERLTLLETEHGHFKEDLKEIASMLKMRGGMSGKERAAVWIAFFTSAGTFLTVAVQTWWG